MLDAADRRPPNMSQNAIDDEEDALWIQGHRWTDTSLGLANRCWRTIARGIIQSNSILKNVLDKYWHGKNRAKDSTAPCTAALCRICNDVDSQIHILLMTFVSMLLMIADEMTFVLTPLCDYAITTS